ncbi:MAG: L-aspartate oxidase, partial [Planctomycetota bacterium]
MAERLEFRRYLVDIDSISSSQLFTDCLVIGTGIAGLRAALEAAEHRNVIVVCKGKVRDSNTFKAQGGIASAIDEADTLKTGCGLCDEEVVGRVVRQGPELVDQLLRWNTEFDLAGDRIATTLEGGHSHPRVAHAHGDETGRIIAEALIEKVRQNAKIRILENFFTVDLLTGNHNKCMGIIGRNGRGESQIIWAARTILATGGVGRLYRETTNPEGATGDGIAMAYRAGAVLRDLEFVQFHPTTLYIAGATRALITETIRGEGAVLVDNEGRKFMKDYHEAAELAPRDIVSRAILSRMRETESTNVYLDVRHFDKTYFAGRFPYINELLDSFDIDISKDLIPVRPSAHYMIGG